MKPFHATTLFERVVLDVLFYHVMPKMIPTLRSP